MVLLKMLITAKSELSRSGGCPRYHDVGPSAHGFFIKSISHFVV